MDIVEIFQLLIVPTPVGVNQDEALKLLAESIVPTPVGVNRFRQSRATR